MFVVLVFVLFYIKTIGVIKIWDFENKVEKKTLKGHVDCIMCLCKYNEDYLASGSADCTIKIWEWKLESQNALIKSIRGHDTWVKCLTSLNGYLLSGSDDRTIKVWDSNFDCIKTLKGHKHSIRGLHPISDKRFASASFDGNIKIWDISNFSLVQTLTGHKSNAINVILLKDGKLASCSNDKCIILWEQSN